MTDQPKIDKLLAANKALVEASQEIISVMARDGSFEYSIVWGHYFSSLRQALAQNAKLMAELTEGEK